MAESSSTSAVARAEPRLCDAVGHFFQAMPTPEEHHTKPLAEIAHKLYDAAVLFNRNDGHHHAFGAGASTDCNIIMRALEEWYDNPDGKGWSALYDHLGGLALSADIDANDTTPRAMQLRYLRWVVSGRKDATSPFRQPDSHGSAPASEARCAACGTDVRLDACAGCRLSCQPRVGVTTWYCSKPCQTRDWPKHKKPCRETRRLVRVVSIFSDIFRHAIHTGFPLTSITVKDGIVVATTSADVPRYTLESGWISDGPKKTVVKNRGKAIQANTGYKSLSDLTDDRNIATAVLMHAKCHVPLAEARSLFELLIRPACKAFHKVVFVPRNMDRPVRIAAPDFDEFSALYAHEAIRATLDCGAEYAIDLTGMQMGWEETVVPWGVYERRRVLRVVSTEPVLPGETGMSVLTVDQAEDTEPYHIQGARLMDRVAAKLAASLAMTTGKAHDTLRAEVADYKGETWMHAMGRMMPGSVFEGFKDGLVQEAEAEMERWAIVGVKG